MSDPISRRSFSSMTAGVVVGGAAAAGADSSAAEPVVGDDGGKALAPKSAPGPVEAAFQRDYSPPSFKPSWKKPQINRLLVQDFVIYAHSELDMVKKLLDREPMLLNATMDWGGGDWESGLGGASHMGRHDIVEYLLGRGARIDIFCAAMMGRLEAVKSFLTLQPALIDVRGPHGFTLHFHAQVGGPEAQPVLDYLQSIKHIELRPNPFLKKEKPPAPGHAAEKGK